MDILISIDWDKSSAPPTKCLQYLLDYGIDVNEPYLYGKNDIPLRAIVFCTNRYLKEYSFEIAEMLLNNGAIIVDEDLTDRRCLAIALEDEKRFDLFLAHGALR